MKSACSRDSVTMTYVFVTSIGGFCGASWGVFPSEIVGDGRFWDGRGHLFTNGSLVKFCRFQCLSIGKMRAGVVDPASHALQYKRGCVCNELRCTPRLLPFTPTAKTKSSHAYRPLEQNAAESCMAPRAVRRTLRTTADPNRISLLAL